VIKISISGSSTVEQQAAMNTAIFEAVQSYLGQFPAESVKTNWRKERRKKITTEVDVPLELVTDVTVDV
jgi:hypothetical protein